MMQHTRVCSGGMMAALMLAAASVLIGGDATAQSVDSSNLINAIQDTRQFGQSVTNEVSTTTRLVVGAIGLIGAGVLAAMFSMGKFKSNLLWQYVGGFFFFVCAVIVLLALFGVG